MPFDPSEPASFIAIERPFKGKKCIYHENELLVSACLLNGIDEALREASIPDDHYVLCVKYSNGLDTQIFITGTIEKGEEPITTALGELREELRFGLNSSESLRCLNRYSDGNYNAYWYSCNISDMRFVGIVSKRPETRIKNSYKAKVCCIVHGTKDEVLSAMSSFDASDKTGHDNIISIVAIEMSEAKKIIDRIVQQKKAGDFKKIPWGKRR